MKVATLVSNPNEYPLWKYVWGEEQKEFLVKEGTCDENGRRDCIVQSPSGRCYIFCDHQGLVEELLKSISEGNADTEEHLTDLDSIWDYNF